MPQRRLSSLPLTATRRRSPSRLLAWSLLGLLLPSGVEGQDATDTRAPVEKVVYSVAPTRSGEKELAMDLYRPGATPPRGAVVLMHGGGFTSGSRDIGENRAYGEALAHRGYLAAAISYRLHADGPVVSGWAEDYSRAVRRLEDPRVVGLVRQLGPTFTDAVAAAAVDEIAAVDWLRRHAAELGIDPDRIALFGASAGAITGLTTAYALHLYGREPLDVACVIDLRGLLLRPESAGNPFGHGAPPLLILHGEADRRIPPSEAEEVFHLAKEAGVPVELYTAPGYGHDLGGAALLHLKLDPETTVLDRIDAFLNAAFAGEPVPARSLRGRLLPADAAPRDPGRGRGPESQPVSGD